MHVLMINGSTHERGCTYTALSEVAGQLEQQGITTSILHIGHKPIRGCTGCGSCLETGYCVFKDDPVNTCVDLAAEADGIVVGCPVYFSPGPQRLLVLRVPRPAVLRQSGKVPP